MRFSSRKQLLRFALFASAVSLCLTQRALGQQPAAAEDAGLSVEKIYTRPGLALPLARGVAWSPDGKWLSFLQAASSGPAAKTDLYAVDPTKPGEPPRVLVDSDKLREVLPVSRRRDTQATGLGRLAAQQYQWAPTSKAFLFVSDDNLYWYDLETQSAKRLLAERPAAEASGIKDARISPDAEWVAFVRNHDIWVVELASGRELQITRGGSEELRHGELDWVYPEELSIREAYWWSPDSKQIAFLEMDERPVTKYPVVNFLTTTGETDWERYPKAGDANPVVRVGVVGIPPGGELFLAPRWMDAGSDTSVYLARVGWLPDAKNVAIERLNRGQNRLDLLVAEASTGRSRVLLHEEDPHWINVADDLYYFRDSKRFLWSSELSSVSGAPDPNRGGFRHLYLYDLDGKLLKQLTHGDWEVTSVNSVDEEHGFVYFTATETSVRERHVYRVSLETGEMTRLTTDAGTHNASFSPDNKFYLDTFSAAMTPPVQYLQRADAPHGLGAARRLAGGASPALEVARVQPPEWLTVPAGDGTLLQAMMIRPSNFDPAKKYPAIVALYGGPGAQLVVDGWGGSTFLFNQLLAQKGYIVFTLDNRGSSGRGHAFETPLDQRFGEIELADQLAGVVWLKRQPYVDSARIGIRGWSYGGFMALTAMFRAADVFKAGFAGAPVTDWRQYDTIYTERYMGTPQENPEGYKNSSPVNHVAKLRGKLLIAAGTGDDNVHFANTVELSEAMINAGRYAEIQLYPGRGHGISDQPGQLHLFQRVLQFFFDNL